MMNNSMIMIDTSYGREAVQLTGRVNYSTMEVFRRGRVEPVPKKLLLAEDQHRIPAEGQWRNEEEEGYFFIPKDRLTFVEDERVAWLANRVWRRLPALERRVLYELGTLITDTEESSFAMRYLYESGRQEYKEEPITERYPAQYAEGLSQNVYLAEAKTLESDEAAMFVIAREFAKVVLRQPALFATAGSLISSEPDEDIYTEHLGRQVRWGQDHATLQSWLWGFEEELEAYLKIKPNGRHKKWFKLG